MSFADAISVASAVVQLVQFSSNLLSGARSIYHNAQLNEYAELDAVRADLDAQLNDMAKHHDKATQLGFEQLIGLCRAVAWELSDALQKLAVRESGSRFVKMGRSISASLRSIWSKEKIADLQQRLETIRDEIQFKLVIIVSQRTQELASSFAVSHDQLLEMSQQAADRASEFKLENRQQYLRMTDMERQVLESLETQNHALYEIAAQINAESEEQHRQTRDELWSVHDALKEHESFEHGETRRHVVGVEQSIQRVDSRLERQHQYSAEHTERLVLVSDRVASINDRLVSQEEAAKKAERDKAASERRSRTAKNVSRMINPRDRYGRRLRLTPGQQVARYTLAASTITIFYGSEAIVRMRESCGNQNLGVGALIPGFDTGVNNAKKAITNVGGHVKTGSIAGFEATRGFISSLPKRFNPALQPVQPLVEVEAEQEEEHLIELFDNEPSELESDAASKPIALQYISRVQVTETLEVEEVLPQLPPRRPNANSSPRPIANSLRPSIAPKPQHLRSPPGSSTSVMTRAVLQGR